MLCLRIFKRPNWGAIFAPPLGHVYKNWQPYDLHPTAAIAPAQLAAQTNVPSTGMCALAHVGLQLSLALACLRAWTPAPVWCDTDCCLFLLRLARAFLCWAGCRAAWWTASEVPLASAARARCSHEQRPPPTLALRVPRCVCHRRRDDHCPARRAQRRRAPRDPRQAPAGADDLRLRAVHGWRDHRQRRDDRQRDGVQFAHALWPQPRNDGRLPRAVRHELATHPSAFVDRRANATLTMQVRPSSTSSSWAVRSSAASWPRSA